MTDRPVASETGRRRLSKADRLVQLLDVARSVIAAEGTDALTLGRLAEAAGITKPTVYDHFGTRSGLLAALYRDFDARQNRLLDIALNSSTKDLDALVAVVAQSYVDCVLAEGREIPGVLAALDGSPELASLKGQCQIDFMRKCRTALLPHASAAALSDAALWAMVGAAEMLSAAAVKGQISRDEACHELHDVISSLAQRHAPRSAST